MHSYTAQITTSVLRHKSLKEAKRKSLRLQFVTGQKRNISNWSFVHELHSKPPNLMFDRIGHKSKIIEVNGLFA